MTTPAKPSCCRASRSTAATTISGLGAVIINSANNFDTATMFVPIILLMVMAIGLNSLIGYVERKVAPWQAEIAGRERE